MHSLASPLYRLLLAVALILPALTKAEQKEVFGD